MNMGEEVGIKMNMGEEVMLFASGKTKNGFSYSQKECARGELIQLQS